MVQLKSQVIYVCEDDVSITEVLEEILSDEGYAVKVTRTSETLFSLLEKQLPDLLLLDLRVPTLGGQGVIAQLKQHPLTAKIPVILLSADQNLAELAVQAAADDFIAKPFEIEELIEKVKGWLK